MNPSWLVKNTELKKKFSKETYGIVLARLENRNFFIPENDRWIPANEEMIRQKTLQRFVDAVRPQRRTEREKGLPNCHQIETLDDMLESHDSEPVFSIDQIPCAVLTDPQVPNAVTVLKQVVTTLQSLIQALSPIHPRPNVTMDQDADRCTGNQDMDLVDDDDWFR